MSDYFKILHRLPKIKLILPIFLLSVFAILANSKSVIAAGTISSDSFARTVNNTWGNSETNNPYTISGTASDYSVNYGTGKIKVNNSTSRSALLNTISGKDVEINLKLSVDKLANNRIYYYAVARKNGTDEYRIKVSSFNTSVYLQPSKIVGSSEVAIAPEVKVANINHKINTFINIKSQITGSNPTTIKIKAWQDGQSEPSAWAINSTDSTSSLQGNGTFGLRIQGSGGISNGPITTSFDNFTITDLSGPTPTPTNSPTPTLTPTPTITPSPTPATPTPTIPPGVTPYPAISPFPYPENMLYGTNLNLNYLTANIKDSSGRDLIDMANTLGIKLIRINLWNSPTDPNTGLSTVTKAQWDTILNKMASYGIKAVIMPHNNSYNATEIFNDRYVPYMYDLAVTKGLATNPNVWLMNLANEPFVVQSNMDKMTTARNIIKSANPNMLVNVGGWKTERTPCPAIYQGSHCWENPADAYKVNSLNDFYSIHHYDYDRPETPFYRCNVGAVPPFPMPVNPVYPDPYDLTHVYMSEVRANLNEHYPNENKPMFLEEFGASNTLKCTDQKAILPTFQMQADIYEGIYSALRDDSQSLNIIGSSNWSLYENCPLVNARGLAILWKVNASGALDCNGTYKLLPATDVLKSFALPTPTVTPALIPTDAPTPTP